MPPQAISAGLALLESLIEEEPALAGAITTLLSKANPTPQDWQNLRARVLVKSYEDYDKTFVTPAAGAPAPATPTPATAPLQTQSSPAVPITTIPVAFQTEQAATSTPATATSPASSISTSAAADTAAAAPLTATAPAMAPAKAPTLADAFPPDHDTLAALVATATPAQLQWLYQAGTQLSTLVNQIWSHTT